MKVMEQLGLNQMVRFRVYFEGKGASSAAVMLGAAVFLRIVYYFGFGYFSEAGASGLILNVILPVLLCGGAAVLLKGLRFGMLRVYGILASIYSILMMVWTFDPESIFHFVLAVVWYLVTIAVVWATVEGYLANRVVMQLAFLLPVLYRFFFFDLGTYITAFKLVEFLPEASNLCGLLAWSSFSRCLMPERVQNHFEE